jgi:putative inorganic carbon (HCO3(-)) transporter
MRVFYTLVSAFCVLCILFTWSRGAWLALFLQFFLFLLFYSQKTRRLLCFSPLLLLSVPFLPNNFRARLFSIGDLGESSIRYRLLTWQGSLKMLAAHPFGIGVGERAWRAVYPHFAMSGTKTVMHAHNLFLEVWAELGAVGLAVFLLLVGRILASAVKGGKKAAVLSLSGALVMGFFDHLWYYPGMLMPFFAFLALCASGEQKATQKSRFVDILHEK